jgi:type II secretion system protein G
MFRHRIPKYILRIIIVFIILDIIAPSSSNFQANEALDEARKEQAKIQMIEIMKGLELYKLDNGKYPTRAQGLKALVVKPTTEPHPNEWSQYLDRMPLDPWGNKYIYLCPSSTYNRESNHANKNEYCYCELICYGPDGKESMDDIKFYGIPNICYASRTGDINAVKSFLNENPQVVNINNVIGYPTPLLCAITGDKIDVVRLLLDHGADINTYDPFDAALHIAVEHDNIEILNLLVAAKGVDINIKNVSGETPLHMASYSKLPHKIEILKLLISKGADINARDDDGYTPLHRAIDAGNMKIVKILVLKGANVNEKTKNGDSPLKLAQKNNPNSSDIVDFLRKFGAKE